MNSTDNRLKVTLDQLARMHEAFAELQTERSRYSDEWFAVLAEGPLDAIQRLEDEVNVLTGRTAFQFQAAELSIRVVGPGLVWPGNPLSVLTNFADALRKGIQAIAEMVLTGDLSSRPTRALNEACDLQLMGLATGSLVIQVALPSPPQGSLWPPEQVEAASKGFDLLLAGTRWAGGTAEPDTLASEIPNEALRRLVLTQTKRLLPRTRGRVTHVELTGTRVQQDRIALSRDTIRRVDAAIDVLAATTTETYEGDLREIDLDRRTLVVRGIEGPPFEVACEFAPELDEVALEALDKRIEITGTRPVAATRRQTLLKVHRLTIIEREET